MTLLAREIVPMDLQWSGREYVVELASIES